jgi:vitamin B12 transporter
LFPKVQLAAGVRHNEPDNGEAETVWSASGRWEITPTLFMRGTLGTAFRLPDAYELFAIDPCCEAGNPNLKPEESRNVNLSIGGTWGSAGAEYGWEVVGFHRRIENLIDIVFSDTLGIDTLENVEDEVKVRGALLVATAAFPSGLSLKANYTFTEAEASGSNLQIQDIPESHAKLYVDYGPKGSAWGASLTLNHVGDVFRNLGIGRQRFGDYTTLDLNARLSLGSDKRHRLGMRLENAFDEEYATRVRQGTPDGGGPGYAYWFLGTPRTLHATYSYHF